MERLITDYAVYDYVGFDVHYEEWYHHIFPDYFYLKYENATPSDLSPYISVYDYEIATESPKFTTYGVIYEIDSKALWESADYVKYFHSRIDKNLSRLTREDADRLGAAANNYVRTHKGHNMYIWSEVTIENETGAWKKWKNLEKSINPNDFYE